MVAPRFAAKHGGTVSVGQSHLGARDNQAGGNPSFDSGLQKACPERSERVEESLLLFVGSEDFLKEEALKRLKKSQLPKEGQNIDYHLFYADQTDLSLMIDTLTTFPFASGKKLVLIKDIERLPVTHREPLLKYCQSPLKSTCLVLETSLSDKRDKFLLAISRYAKVVNFKPLRSRENITVWIRERARIKEAEIEKRAVDLLREVFQFNLRAIDNAISSLCCFIGKRSNITVRDVNAVILQEKETTVFQLTDAMLARQPKLALAAISNALKEGRSSQEIIGLLTWGLRRIREAKVLVGSGVTPAIIAQNLRMEGYFLARFLKQIDNFTIDKLKKMVRLLSETDLNLKTRTLNEEEHLDYLMVRLCR